MGIQQSDMSNGLNASKGVIYGSIIGFLQEDTRSLDHRSCVYVHKALGPVLSIWEAVWAR